MTDLNDIKTMFTNLKQELADLTVESQFVEDILEEVYSTLRKLSDKIDTALDLEQGYVSGAAKTSTKSIKIRKMADDEIVDEVEVNNPTVQKVERVVAGILINLANTYYIDDSDFDYLTEE